MRDAPALFLALCLFLGFMTISETIEKAAETFAKTVCEARHD